MTKKEKLIASVLHNPKAVRFDDACKIALEIGFINQGGKGSHSVFKPGRVRIAYLFGT